MTKLGLLVVFQGLPEAGFGVPDTGAGPPQPG